MLKKVVFLDRDGVINYDSPNYIKSWGEFHFIQGSLRGIRELTKAGFSCFVITNQSAVNRKMITRSGLEYIHDRMKEAVSAHGGRIENIFYCPHLPEEGCRCRKPETGLILKARDMYSISLPHSIMIGDSGKDIACGQNAGCGLTILVRTGIDTGIQMQLRKSRIYADYIAGNLYNAVQWILSRFKKSGI